MTLRELADQVEGLIRQAAADHPDSRNVLIDLANRVSGLINGMGNDQTVVEPAPVAPVKPDPSRYATPLDYDLAMARWDALHPPVAVEDHGSP